MVRSPCRRVVAAVVAAIVAGIALHDAAGTERATSLDAPPREAAVVSDWAPAGAVSAARRARGGGDGDLQSILEALRTPALGPAAALAAVAAPVWWVLRRPSGGAGPRLRRTPLPVLRAPPAGG
ncbi:MAG TPA: hypothetical protein VIL48_09915 [Acidimicrobiales bacterium]